MIDFFSKFWELFRVLQHFSRSTSVYSRIVNLVTASSFLMLFLQRILFNMRRVWGKSWFDMLRDLLCSAQALISKSKMPHSINILLYGCQILPPGVPLKSIGILSLQLEVALKHQKRPFHIFQLPMVTGYWFEQENPQKTSGLEKKWVSTIHTPMDVHNPHSKWMSTIWMSKQKWMSTMDVHSPHSKWMSTIHTPNGCPKYGCPQSTLQIDVHNPHSKWMFTSIFLTRGF